MIALDIRTEVTKLLAKRGFFGILTRLTCASFFQARRDFINTYEARIPTLDKPRGGTL